jgi:phosphoserine phosphatase
VAETHREEAPWVDPDRRDGDDDEPFEGGLAAPLLQGYDVAGWYLPAEETGGDFFDFQEPGAGRLAVALGDVSGHGCGPARLAVACRALFRAILSQTHEPARLISEVNRLLGMDDLDDRFVTAFFGVLRRESHRLEYVSAGQGPILFYSHRGGSITELEIQGFPLGLAPGLAFGPGAEVVFDRGDFLALVTDGFFEWFNEAGECFGIERTKAQIVRDRDKPAAEMIRRLHASVLHFAAGSPQPDDLTAVVIKRLA